MSRMRVRCPLGAPSVTRAMNDRALGRIRRAECGFLRRAARRVRLRASTSKTRTALWVELPDVHADALDGRSHRERIGITVPLCSPEPQPIDCAPRLHACKAAGVPVFSPHDLRHRRISLLHRHGRSWAEIARFVGQRKLSITADTYTHVLSDGREVELDCLLTNYPQARDRSTNAPR